MAAEIPSSLIRQIQAVLRRDAGVPAYDPGDPAIRGFPTLEEAIAGLDPTAPPYLRCKKCRAKLLRGLQSTACVFCGAEQRREGPPQTISFNSTTGYRKLLESLDLDGSEAVSLNTESKDSSKGRDKVNDGLVLSGLLDLELRWPFENEEVQNSRANMGQTQSTYSLNLSGVDLDNFFSETKAETSSRARAWEEMPLPEKEIMNIEHHISSDSESFSLFENLRSSDKAATSVDTKPNEFSDSFADWEAEFQSAGSEIPSADPKSNDFFQGSSINLASVKVGKQTNIGTEVNREGKNGVLESNVCDLSSVSENWIPGDLWHATDGVSNTAEQFKSNNKSDSGELKTNSDNTSMGDRWIQDSSWHTSSTIVSSNNGNNHGIDDSFDDWQDFTSSGNAPETLSNSWPQTVTEATLSNEHASEVHPGHLTDKLEDMDFGSFFQSYSSSATKDAMKESSDMEKMQLEASISGRMNEWEKSEMHSTVWPAKDKIDRDSPAKQQTYVNSNIEALLSQMHDLSFMLESDLALPKKVESSDPTS